MGRSATGVGVVLFIYDTDKRFEGVLEAMNLFLKIIYNRSRKEIQNTLKITISQSSELVFNQPTRKCFKIAKKGIIKI